MEMVHARDTARAVALERMADANVYTCNGFYTAQSWLRKDRHVAGDWNQSSERGVACKMRRMAIRFGKVFIDYIYLPGTSYTALRYAKEGFFKFTLPAIPGSAHAQEDEQRGAAGHVFARYEAHVGQSLLHRRYKG